MEASDISTEVILAIPNCEIYEIKNGAKTLMTSGILNVVTLPNGQHTIAVNDWAYTLAKEIPVMKNDYGYVVPHMECFFGVMFKKAPEADLEDAFETLLNESATFLVRTTDLTDKQVDIKDGKPKKNKTEKFKEYADKGSKWVKSGLISGATKASKGLQSGGKYLKKKLKKNETETKVSTGTKTKIVMAKAASQSALIFTRQKVTAIIEVSKAVAGAVADSIEQSETGQKYKDNKKVEKSKEVAKASIVALGTVWDGFEEALVIMAKGFKDTTVDVVEHKYGSDAAKATGDSLDVVGTVGQMGREANKLTIKGMAKTVAKETGKELVNRDDQKKAGALEESKQ